MPEPRSAKQPARHVLVNGVPKSGTLFLARTACTYLQVAQTRIATRGWSSQADAEAILNFVAGPEAVAQQHIVATEYNLRVLKHCGLTRFVQTLRDPRDVLVSWAHQMLRPDSRAQPFNTPLMIASGLITPDYYDLPWERQLDCLIDHGFPVMQDWVKGWSLNLKHHGFDIHFILYEDFSADVEGTVRRMFSFLNFDGGMVASCLPEIKETRGEIDPSTHFRRGLPGGFRDELSLDQRKRLSGMLDKDLYNRFGWSDEI